MDTLATLKRAGGTDGLGNGVALARREAGNGDRGIGFDLGCSVARRVDWVLVAGLGLGFVLGGWVRCRLMGLRER